MLVRFETPAYATIVMFGEVAVALLKLMGHSGTVPGALLAADIPQALAKLKAAVAEHPNVPLDPSPQSQRPLDERESVSLAHRALPLIELLEAAARAGENVIWEQA